MIQVFIEVRITYSSQHNQLPAVLLCLWRLSHLLPSVKDKVSLSQPLSGYPLLGWVVLDSFQKKRVLDNKNRKQKNYFLQKIKMIFAVIGAFKRPVEGILIFWSFGEKNGYLLRFWTPLSGVFNIYTYIYIHMYIYIYICIYSHICNTYICTRRIIYVHVCVYVYVYI